MTIYTIFRTDYSRMADATDLNNWIKTQHGYCLTQPDRHVCSFFLTHVRALVTAVLLIQPAFSLLHQQDQSANMPPGNPTKYVLLLVILIAQKLGGDFVKLKCVYESNQNLKLMFPEKQFCIYYMKGNTMLNLKRGVQFQWYIVYIVT